jgi:hypothetical protein
MQHRLKPKTRATWAWVITAKLLQELLVTVDDSVATLDLSFRWEAFSTLARYLKTNAG